MMVGSGQHRNSMALTHRRVPAFFQFIKLGQFPFNRIRPAAGFRILIAHKPLSGIVELGHMFVCGQCEIVKASGAQQLDFGDLSAIIMDLSLI